MDRSNQITKLIEFYNMKPKISRPIPTINYLKALTEYECKSICNKLKIRLVGVYMKDEYI